MKAPNHTRCSSRSACFAGVLFAASITAAPALAGKADNSVVFAFDQTLQSADPYFNNQLIGTIVADQVWDTLIFRHPDTGVLTGNLATAWRWVDDRTLELDLRRGVKFHNGAEFDADDVVYTLGLVSKPETRVSNPELARWIDRVEKLDQHKVRIVAKQPVPVALTYLASPSFVIHPRDYYARVGPTGMNQRPVGTGPFRVAEHARGKYLRLVANPDYFNGGPKSRPKLDKVEIRFIPDAQTRVAETVSGGVDLIPRVSRDQAEQLRAVPGLKIVSAETNGYAYIQINSMPNTPAPQLRDVRVRRAIMHAIDRDAMTKFIVGEDSRVLHAECHPNDFGCDDTAVPRYAYDPQKARQLLAEAGLADGFDIDLYAWRDRNQTEAIIGYLGAVGIRARMRFLQFPAVRAAVRSGRAPLTHSSLSASGDVSTTVSLFHNFSPDDVNRDPELRRLLQEGDSAMDPEARKAAYRKAFVLIAEQAYVLPLYSVPGYYISARDLEFKPYADNILRFWEMSYR